MKSGVFISRINSSSVKRRSFSFPHEVLEDPGINAREKRAILCEWASDACAVESFPALRHLPGTTFPVTLSAVMDALHQLDRKPLVYAGGDATQDGEHVRRTPAPVSPEKYRGAWKMLTRPETAQGKQ